MNILLDREIVCKNVRMLKNKLKKEFMGRVMCKIAEKASRQFHYDRTTAVQTYLYCTNGIIIFCKN